MYAIIVIINLLLPLVLLERLIFDYDIFDAGFINIIKQLLGWAIIAFAGWVSFQLLWDRKTKISFSSNDNAEFVVTPAFSHLIQTFGEWIGTYIGLVGFCFPLFMIIVYGNDAVYYRHYGFLRVGWRYVLLSPVFGFLVILWTRFLAEQIKALAAIANNTKHRQTSP